jgi:hypothetical protein
MGGLGVVGWVEGGPVSNVGSRQGGIRLVRPGGLR